MPLSRKHFVTAAALGVSAAALRGNADAAAPSDQRVPIHFHVLKPNEYNHGLMLKKLSTSNKNKQVFQSVSPLVIAPGVASLYLHMQNSLNAYQFSFGMGPGSLSTLGVLIGPSIVFALNDATWKKYNIGGALNLAATNIYYRATSNLKTSASADDPNGMYQDWSAQAIMKRGGMFMVCHNAATAVAASFAQKSGKSPQAVLSDFVKNLLPGFQLVPAGVGAVQAAQELGWKIYPII